ncbi:hypothetical protein [Acidipropionibacterium virtanenii]|uniref:Integral membrane protein n=1 Tax=Acidipropionibacterium virtanenii TaxID=2057246 RepID=A0A344URY5_9ACTN|nr:hypothetical protein [Acidipropionibacterium virtanenii]AXE38033.1 hypothetical protein JS278_00846 [Acidipropionibacterium virtanenii]
MNTWRGAAFIGGMLVANSLPHLVTAARRRYLLTPYGGQDSGPLANLAWGMTNLAAGTAVTVCSRARVRWRAAPGGALHRGSHGLRRLGRELRGFPGP